MNGKIAKLIRKVTAKSPHVLRRALKREWLATPSDKRSRGVLRAAISKMAAATPTVEDYATR